MKKINLGVNIDHIATIRNARGEWYPEPLQAALVAQKCGADSITIHLREDRRHIKDIDLKKIREKIKIPLNLEIAATKEMLRIAIKNKPNYVCIVPEKRVEITTEGGLNLNKNSKNLRRIIFKLKKNKIRVALFIEPKKSDILKAKKLGVHCIEIHTGKFCNLVNKNKNYKNELKKIVLSSKFGKKIGLEVHAGHGLTYESTKIISKVKYISEYNIGHFIVAESIFVGLKKTIKEFIKILNK
jgi:pyridoxine 5-phosphate synthase